MKFFYLYRMIMKAIKAIVNRDCKCPICGTDAKTMTKAEAERRKLHLVCENEYYIHYQWAGHHYMVRKEQSVILELEMSLC